MITLYFKNYRSLITFQYIQIQIRCTEYCENFIQRSFKLIIEKLG